MILPTIPFVALAEARLHVESQHLPVFHRITQHVPPGACTNCAGIRFVYLSFSKAGPFQFPPNSHQPVLHVDADGGPDGHAGGWYIVETRGYPCPVCQNGASRKAAAAQAA